MDATQLLSDIRLIPVVTLSDVDTAAPLADALLAAGVGAIEVTLRTEVALECIERIAREVPSILLGVGSIRNVEQFNRVRDAGAGFAVSPGTTDALLDAACIPYIPGAATASECLRLQERGYRLVKFFPAEAAGGAAAIRGISAPLPELRFCPTGGVTAENVAGYIKLPAVVCVGGSWFIDRAKLQTRDFDGIEADARHALTLLDD